jgi:pilus assembly protein CpaB
MRPFVLVLVLLAFGIATLTAVLFSRVLSRHEQAAPVAAVAAPPAESVEIIVAADDIKVGDVVKAGDLRIASWPQAAVDQRYLRKDTEESLVGSIARQPLFAGQPITAAALFHRGEAGVMAGVLSPGMRAVSIAVSATTGVSGFVLPNDHIDILLDQDVHAATGQADDQPGRGNLLRYASETILTDVRVLAVDDKLPRPDSPAVQSGKTVTLEVSPKDAETLVLAARMGELVLALRSMTPGEGKPAAYVGDVAASVALRAALHPGGGPFGGIQINRGGVISTQSFVN